MKEDLCKAFCEELLVREIPAGFAIGTGFSGMGGDPIGFYVTGPDQRGRYRIQDDGLTLFNLEGAGADLEISSRMEAFQGLLSEYGFNYDEAEHILVSDPLSLSEIAVRSVSFVALLLRVQDLLFLVQERAASTFKEEALREIRDSVNEQVEITENDVLAPSLSDTPADVIFRAPNRRPVALFFGTSDNKVSEAVILDMQARHEAKIDCAVIALLEKETSINHKTRQRAMNRLAAVAAYRGDEKAAIARVLREVNGELLH